MQSETPIRGAMVIDALPAIVPMLVARIGESRTAEDLRDWLSLAAQMLGFVGCHYVHVGHSLVDPEHRARDWPARFLSTREWADRSTIATWLGADPIAVHIRAAFAPFTWSTAPFTEGPQSASRPDAASQAWLSVERGQGVRGGAAVPVQDYSAGPAYLNFFGRDAEHARLLCERGAPELAFIGMQFHARAKQLLLLSDRAHVQTALTSREIDCLRLAALGWTVADTGAALGITGRTVEFHLKNAAEKLGAPSKVRAVALAVGRGLIHF